MEEPHFRSLTVDSVKGYTQSNADFISFRGALLARVSLGNTEAIEKVHTTLYKDPMRINAVMFGLCVEGKGVMHCNLNDVLIQAGDLIVIAPNSIVQKQASDEPFCGYILLIDPQYLGECNINVKKIITQMLNRMSANGVVHLSPEEMHRMRSLYALMHATFSDTSTSDFREDVIRSQIELITYQVCEFIARNASESRGSSAKSSRADLYFRRFIKELSEHYLERQSVSFYADRLCISARYLTTIVRRVSGSSVTDWMHRYLLMEAKYLLKYSDLSIQEIAYQLSFPNQSFFGKYFKQHTGFSPSAYRQGY